tara:strand:+ start:258 stop:947 length:690 start_codon:yes stop_codon:yes gene_type:complete
MNTNKNRVLLLIPAYNEESRISKVIKKCKKYFRNIIIIDDGSTDLTYEESLKCKPSVILRHIINCGQGTALATGIRYFVESTDFDYLVTFDGDGQHRPEDAISMLNYTIKNNFDAVFGSRFLKNKSLLKVPLMKRIALKIAKIFENIFFGISLSDAHNGLRVLSRDACLNLLNLHSSSMANGTEIAFKLIRANIKIREFPCTILYNSNSKESQSPLAGLNIISDLIQRK